MPTLPAPTPGPVGGTQDVFYARRTPVPLPMIDRAEGIRMWDEDGKEYIDASSGPMVSAVGHGNGRIIDAMAAQARRLDYAYSRVARNRPNLDYAARLAALAGPGFERVSLASGGSEAIDNALKFLRQHALVMGRPQRRHVISLMPSYHGATIGALAIGGSQSMMPFLDGFAAVGHTVPAPLSYRLPANHTAETYAADCAAALEAKIRELGPETVLAFVIEPVGGLSTGAVVPPHAYFRAVRDICNRHGVHLVFDEVLCGAGRTGRFFTAHYWPDALPDIIVQAKGIGAGYSPLGAMLAPASMVDAVAARTGFEFSYSYNANPISCAAGLAVLDEFERLDLVDRARTLGAGLRDGLVEIMAASPAVGDVRGRGLLLAVELVADKTSKASFPPAFMANEKIRLHGLRHGVMLYARPTPGSAHGHWFMVAPPLTITEAEVQELLRRTRAAVDGFRDEAKAAGLI